MPKYQRRNRKRIFKRKRRNYRVARMPSLLGNKKLVKLKYNETLQLNPGAAGAIATYVFSANGMYDPNVTSTGHQPRGFDQLMALYNQYTVIGSKINVTFIKGGSQATSDVVGVCLRKTSTVDTSLAGYLEDRNVRYSALSSNSTYRVVKKAFSTKKFLGVSHPLSEDTVKADASNNPTLQGFFHLFAGPTYSVDSEAIDVNVCIEFTAILTEPIQPTQS